MHGITSIAVAVARQPSTPADPTYADGTSSADQSPYLFSREFIGQLKYARTATTVPTMVAAPATNVPTGRIRRSQLRRPLCFSPAPTMTEAEDSLREVAPEVAADMEGELPAAECELECEVELEFEVMLMLFTRGTVRGGCDDI